MASERWLADFANYESYRGDSENEGSPDLDQVFADAQEFHNARTTETAEATLDDPPMPSPGPAITDPEDAPAQRGAPTAPHAPMSDATRAANIAA